MRQVRDDATHVRNTSFLLWIFALLVCLAFLGFIAFGYLDDVLAGVPKL